MSLIFTIAEFSVSNTKIFDCTKEVVLSWVLLNWNVAMRLRYDKLHSWSYSEISINDHSEKRPNYLPPIHSSIGLMYF